MTTPPKLDELTAAEGSAREILERLGYEYVPCEAPAAERANRRVQVPEATGDRHGQA